MVLETDAEQFLGLDTQFLNDIFDYHTIQNLIIVLIYTYCLAIISILRCRGLLFFIKQLYLGPVLN